MSEFLELGLPVRVSLLIIPFNPVPIVLFLGVGSFMEGVLCLVGVFGLSELSSLIFYACPCFGQGPRYENHRDKLRKVSRDISLSEILGTKEGIAALADFLKATGAFTKTGNPRQAAVAPEYDEELEEGESELEADTDDVEENWDKAGPASDDEGEYDYG